MSEQWLSIVEYARTYRVSDMTVRRRIKNGKLRAVLKDGKYFIPVPMSDGRHADSGHATLEAAVAAERGESRASSGYVPQPSAGVAVAAQTRRPAEMNLMRGHPASHKTFATLPPMAESRPVGHGYIPESLRETSSGVAEESSSDSLIPASLRRPLSAQETSLVDTRALLAFCEATMRKIGENERRTIEKFKSKLEAIEAVVATKDLEIKSLRQQIEDLQLLVKILEKKRPA